jgi:hypothetical protein
MHGSDFARLSAALRQDSALRDEAREHAEDPAAVMNWALGRGLSLSRMEALDLIAGLDELTDDELEEAAGGNDPWAPKP